MSAAFSFFDDEAEAREFALWLALQPKQITVVPHHKITPNTERVMVRASYTPAALDDLRREWDARKPVL